MTVEGGQIIERRRHKRVRLNDPIQYQFKETSRFGGCIVRDLSEGGMRVNFEDFLPLHAEMVLQVKLQNIPKVVDLTGQVVWSQRIPFSERYQIGLQFVSVDPGCQELLRSYIKSHHP